MNSDDERSVADSSVTNTGIRCYNPLQFPWVYFLLPTLVHLLYFFKFKWQELDDNQAEIFFGVPVLWQLFMLLTITHHSSCSGCSWSLLAFELIVLIVSSQYFWQQWQQHDNTIFLYLIIMQPIFLIWNALGICSFMCQASFSYEVQHDQNPTPLDPP